MENRQNITIIERIFDESQNVGATEKELEEKLKNIGIEPDALVASGLARITKLLDVEKKIDNNSISQFPIAASKNKTDPASLKQDLIKQTKEKNKTKKK